MCKLHYFIQSMSYTASITILTVISVERYVAIIHPMRSKQLLQTMWLMRATIVVVWIVSACSGIPNLVIYDTVELPTPDGAAVVAFCMFVLPFNDRAYAVAIFVLWYLLPVLLMTFVYGRISVVLWRSSSNGSSGDRILGIAERNSEMRECSSSRHASTKSVSSIENCRYSTLQKTSEGNRGGGCPQKSRSSVTWSAGTASQSQDAVNCSVQPEGSSSGSSVRTPRGTSSRPSYHCRSSAGSRLSRKELESEEQPSRRETCLRRSTLHNVSRRTVKNNALFSRRKIVRLLLAIVVTFSLCVLPYHVRVLWLAFGRPDPGFWQMLVPPLTFVMYYANSGLNPLLYAFLSEKFRASLTDLVRCGEATRLRRISLTAKTLNTVT